MQRLAIMVVVLVCIVRGQDHWDAVGFTGQNVYSITQHPQDTSIMLISIADSIYRSSDGGHTWSCVATYWPLPINCLLFHPTGGDTAYALIGNGSFSDGIYRSTDAGSTWDIFAWFYIPRCMTATESGVILVGCDSFGIYKSEDGGMSWDPWNEGLTNLHIYALDYCSPFDTFPYFFAGTAQGLFYRHDNGWSQASGIASNVRVSSISYHKTDELGFATVTGGSMSDGMYRSTDFGQNWQVDDYWLYARCVAMNPQWEYPGDTLSVFAGDSGLGVKRSTDCGTTWNEMNTGLGNLFIHALSYHPEDTTRLFAATQGGLYRYVYSVGAHENTRAVSNAAITVPATIVRAHRPIVIHYYEPQTTTHLTIFDAVGRIVSTEVIGKNTMFLAPLEKCGVYFIVSPGAYSFQQKIIVVD
jgi:hypothetical protein